MKTRSSEKALPVAHRAADGRLASRYPPGAGRAAGSLHLGRAPRERLAGRFELEGGYRQVGRWRLGLWRLKVESRKGPR